MFKKEAITSTKQKREKKLQISSEHKSSVFQARWGTAEDLQVEINISVFIQF